MRSRILVLATVGLVAACDATPPTAIEPTPLFSTVGIACHIRGSGRLDNRDIFSLKADQNGASVSGSLTYNLTGDGLFKGDVEQMTCLDNSLDTAIISGTGTFRGVGGHHFDMIIDDYATGADEYVIAIYDGSGVVYSAHGVQAAGRLSVDVVLDGPPPPPGS